PIIIYTLGFKEKSFLIDSEKWAHFGDFLGGFSALVLGCANLFLLVKLSYEISSIDDKRTKLERVNAVLPYANFEIFKNFNESIFCIGIKNYGIGTLKVHSIDILHMGDLPKKYNNLYEFTTSNFVPDKTFYKCDYDIIEKGTAIMPAETKELLRLKIIKQNGENIDNVESESIINYIAKEFDKIEIVLKYTDIYEMNIYTQVKNYSN
ncbi:MAG: hypothetical protein KIG88_11575, partial [Weeksellaceae bacterium]|nr:hypothetical protein [Weeksellaceae bacterium]